MREELHMSVAGPEKSWSRMIKTVLEHLETMDFSRVVITRKGFVETETP